MPLVLLFAYFYYSIKCFCLLISFLFVLVQLYVAFNTFPSAPSQFRGISHTKSRPSSFLVSCGCGFQVALEFTYSRLIQGEQVKVKGCIGDVEMARLFYEVHNLKDTNACHMATKKQQTSRLKGVTKGVTKVSWTTHKSSVLLPEILMKDAITWK